MAAVSVPWLLASSSETLVLLKASLRGPDFESKKRARFGGRKTAPLFVNFCKNYDEFFATFWVQNSGSVF